MGSCISKNQSIQIRHLTNSIVSSNLKGILKDLVKYIVRFSKINTISNSDLETLILQQNKKSAILLKKKISIINMQIKELQEYLMILGDIEDGRQLENKNFLNECKPY